MRKLISYLIISIFLISAFSTINIAQENKSIKQTTLNFRLSSPLIKNNIDKSEIEIENANAYIMEPGKPILPCYRETYKFPIGTKITNVNVIIEDKQTIELDNDLIIAPQPVQIKKLNSDNNEIKEPEKLEKIFPESDFQYKIGRGLDGDLPTLFLTIQVNPCSFDPKTNRITTGMRATISIEHEQEFEPLDQEETYSLVIITHPDFVDELEPLRNHKENKGISTKIVNLNQISQGSIFISEGRDDIEEIKYFIKNAYDEWGTRNILLVGDSDHLPARDTHIKIPDEENPENSDNEVFLSDLYYADLYDGENNFLTWDSNENNIFAEINQGSENDTMDLYPDVRIGRLACLDEEQVTTVVNKIIDYETNEAWTKNWFNNIIVIGGDTVPGPSGDDSGIDEGELVNQEILDVMEGFIPIKLWATNGRLSGTNPSGVDRINSATNGGCGFIDWSGHGAPWVWTTYPHNGRRQVLPSPWGDYTNGDIEELENNDMLPIVMCGGCSLGKYNSDDNCFSWAYLSNPNGGGIGSFGASALGYVYLGQWATYALVEGLMVRFYEAYDDNAFTLGEMWSDAYNDYINTIINEPELPLQDVDYKTLAEVHLFGDPTLQIRGDSLPPEKPTSLDGPTGELEAGEEYTFTASTTDPNDDQLYYLFDWGDESYSLWLGPYDSGDTVETNKIWSEDGQYNVRVKAKDVYGVQSEWSDPKPVTVPKSIEYKYPIIDRIILLIEKLFPNIAKILI